MITLNEDQRKAVDNMMAFCSDPSKSLYLLQGSAGTGKTTCVQTVLREMDHLEFVLTAPTNKATKVLREMSQKEGLEGVDCRTIYSLLGLRVQKDSEFVRVEPLADSDVNKYNIVVIDEGSMLNEELTGFVREAALLADAKFIIMGDPLQLPPVGEDKSEVFSLPDKSNLTKVERHDNQILTFANSLRDCILKGELPTFRSDNDENGGVYTVDHRRMVNHMRKAYTSEAYLFNPSTCKTIAWRNAAVANYNEIIRDAIYGEAANEMFVLDERVVATHPIPTLSQQDSFDMVTDEEGTVVEMEIIQHPMFEQFKVYYLKVETEFNQTWANCFVIHPDSRKEYEQHLGDLAGKAKRRQLPWSSFWKVKNEFFHDIRPCHSITAHRSQGSTYRSVFVDVEDILSNRNTMEALRCLYVASTRASDILVLKTR